MTGAVPAEPHAAPSTRITIRCARCHGRDVMRDAWAVWDDQTQQWTLGAVFDEAACERCGSDATLVEVPQACEPAEHSR